MFFLLKTPKIGWSLSGWQSINNTLVLILLLINYPSLNQILFITISLLSVFHLQATITRKKILILISAGKSILIYQLSQNFCLMIMNFSSIRLILETHQLLFKLIESKFSSLKTLKLTIILKDLLILLFHFLKLSKKFVQLMSCKQLYLFLKVTLMLITYRNCKKICQHICRRMRLQRNQNHRYHLDY